MTLPALTTPTVYYFRAEAFLPQPLGCWPLLVRAKPLSGNCLQLESYLVQDPGPARAAHSNGRLCRRGRGCCSLPGRPAGALIALHLPSAAPCTPTAVNPIAAPGESPAGKPLSGPASWGPTRAVHQASLSFRSSASSHWNASGFTEN